VYYVKYTTFVWNEKLPITDFLIYLAMRLDRIGSRISDRIADRITDRITNRITDRNTGKTSLKEKKIQKNQIVYELVINKKKSKTEVC